MKPSPTKSRLAGVELTRGLAAFGVIVIHVGLISPVEPSRGVDAWQGFMGLTCVAFFLAAAFYFAALTSSRPEPFPLWLKRRASRLLIPYVLWTLIYTGLQVVQTLPHPDRVHAVATLLSDPVDRIFFGSSGVALYFLPLLFIGLVTMRLLGPLLAGRPTIVLALGFLLSLVPWGLSATGHSPFLQPDSWPHDSPVRFGDRVLEFALRCLPFIFLGWIFARHATALTSFPTTKALVAVAALLLLVLTPIFAYPTPECVMGYAVFLLALVLPVRDFAGAEMVGRYSFGIYLVHQVILEAIKLALHNRPFPLSLGTVLPITVATFATAFALVYLAERFGGKPGRLLMALPPA